MGFLRVVNCGCYQFGPCPTCGSATTNSVAMFTPAEIRATSAAPKKLVPLNELFPKARPNRQARRRAKAMQEKGQR